MTVIYKYLDCGDLHFGFARVETPAKMDAKTTAIKVTH